MKKIDLQYCVDCLAPQYPARDVCRKCLSPQLETRSVEANGKLLSLTTLHSSLEQEFLDQLPWAIGLVEVSEELHIFCHLLEEDLTAGDEVSLFLQEDPGKRLSYFATAKEY